MTSDATQAQTADALAGTLKHRDPAGQLLDSRSGDRAGPNGDSGRRRVGLAHPSRRGGAHRIMAERAGARRTVEIPGASHVVGISHPAEVVSAVLEAAAERTTAAS
jgi:pimeloyl-ACP methyl ester carboxylesterase